MPWPPEFWVLNAQGGKLFGAEEHGPIFVCSEFYGLFKFHAGSHAGYDALYRIGSRIVKFGIDGNVGSVQCAIWKMRDCEWRANGDWSGFDEIDCAPKAHVLIWRTRVPVDPVDAEIFFGRRSRLDRNDVWFAGGDVVSDVKVIGSVSAGDLRGVSNPFAIDPKFTAIVDATEVQLEPIVFREKRGSIELFSIPPRAGIGAVGRHRDIGEVVAYRIGGPRDFAQVVAEVGIGKDSRFYLGG